MNLTRLKEFRVRKKLERLLANKQNTTIDSQQKITSVGILTSVDILESIDVKTQIQTALGVKNVQLYSYRTFSKKNEPSLEYFSEKDINLNGNFIQPNLKDFLEQPFDLMIGYFNEPNLYLETAMVQSKALFKAGFSGVNNKLYQLEIASEPTQIKQFLQELKKYLQILKKLKN